MSKKKMIHLHQIWQGGDFLLLGNKQGLKKILFYLLTVVAVVFVFPAYSQIPAGYYDGTSGLSGDSLKAKLHDIIKNHTTLSYTAVKEALKVTDQDTIDTTRVVCLYTGWTYLKTEFGNGSEQWNREHVWSKSHGNFGDTPPPGTDLHHLRPCDASVNSSKSNRDFDVGTTQYIDGSGPTQCYTAPYIWEPRDEVKGDVARMIFYMATRYEGDSGEPDLEVVDWVNTAPNYDSLYGKLSTLLQWHENDPVDDWERNRNDIIYYNYQNNRNPYIDHPEFVDLIWGDTVRPEPSNHVSAFQSDTATASSIKLSWNDNDGSVAADGFLLMINTSGTFTPPVDTVPQPDDTDLSDSSGRVNVLHGVETYTWNNLLDSTVYYFTIYPYTNSGSDIDYKTDGNVPATLDTTTDVASSSGSYLLISEVADPKDNYKARYVEVYNSGVTSIDFSTDTFYLCRQANGSGWGCVKLTGLLEPDSAYTVAYNSTDFNTAYGFNPDLTSGYISGNGDDGYFLYAGGDNTTGTLVDAYGVVDQDGTGEEWEYLDSKAVRLYGDTVSSAIWNSDSWVIVPNSNTTDMTPRWHRVTVTWNGGQDSFWENVNNWYSGSGVSSFVPDPGSYIVISSSGNQPVISSDKTFGKILLQTGAIITINNNAVVIIKKAAQ